jgi:hypothetical protein
MSLLKRRIMTPARVAASRRNALKSTGPRTPRGKAQSLMNLLWGRGSLSAYQNLWRALVEAPPGGVDEAVRAVLTPEQYAHPKFAELVDIFRQADREVAASALRPDRRAAMGAREASVSPSEA